MSDRVLALIRGIFAGVTEGEFTSSLSTAAAIFLNNLRSITLILFLGIVLGILPLFSVALNSFIVGFLTAYTFAFNWPFTAIALLVAGLVPHGIFEIPALLIAAGFGFKLGYFWRRPEQVSAGAKLLLTLKENVLLFPLLLILIFVAAIVETYVSSYLLSLLIQRG